MTVTALALVLAAAAMHAGWNALARGGRDPLAFLWLSMLAAALAWSPIAAVVLARTGVGAGAWRWWGATAALHAVYIMVLGGAYARGELSRVYPIARGLSVALVAAASWLVLGAAADPIGIAGVALVIAGVATVARAAGPGGAGAGWAVTTGVVIAGYSLVDAHGALAVHPLPYIVGMMLAACALVAPVVLARPGRLAAELRASRRSIALAALFSLSGYALVLGAMRLAPVEYVVASRELAIVMSVAIGRLFLGEVQTPARLAGAAAITAGVIAVTLA